jgi:2-phosphoglycerate kinase
MIYLIGGLPRTGKTLIGSMIIKQTGGFGIDTDHLRALFKADPESKIAFSSRNNFAQATAAIEPYIDALIEYLLTEKRDFVLCGEILTPATLVKFKDACKICFLGFSDSERHLKRVRANQHTNDWTRDLSDERLQQIFDHFKERSAQLKTECDYYKIHYFDMSTDEFVPRVQAVIELLTDTTPTAEYLTDAIAAHMKP